MKKHIFALAKDSSLYGVSTVLSQLVGLILVPYFSRELAPSEYGILSMAALVANFLKPIGGLGMDSGLFKFYSMAHSAEEKTGYFSAASILKLIGVALIVLILLPSYSLLNSLIFEGELKRIDFYIVIGLFVSENISTLAVVALRSERKVKKIALVNVLYTVLSVGLSIYLVLIEHWGVTGALAANLGANIIKTFFFLADSRRNFAWSISKAFSRDLLHYGLPMIPHKIMGQILNLFTVFMINQKLGIVYSGLYFMATKITKPLSFLITIVQSSWLPYKFHIHKTDKNAAETFGKIIPFYWYVLLLFWVGLAFASPYIFYYLIEEKYWPAIPYVPFILFYHLVMSFAFTMSTGFELSDRQIKNLYATIASMIALISLSLVFIDFFPPYSFILAQAISVMVSIYLKYVEARKIIKIKYPMKSYTLVFLMVSAVTVFYYQDISPSRLMIGGIAAVLIVVGGFLFQFPNISRFKGELSRIVSSRRG